MKIDETFTDEVVAIARFVAAFEREAVCCGTVTVPQCVALQLLLDAPLEMAQLAERIGGSTSATTRLVDGLVKRGSVERSASPEDRRRVTATLTAAGRAEARRLREITVRGVRGVLAHVPKHKHAQLLESLRLLRAALEQGRGALASCCA